MERITKNLEFDATTVNSVSSLSFVRSLPLALTLFYTIICLVTMMISRDNINNYVRNLCSGALFNSAFGQFSFCIVHYMFHVAGFFVQQCCDLCMCLCVSMPKFAEEVYRIDGHYSLCHSLLATITLYNNGNNNKKHESDKKHCVLFTWRWTTISIDLIR